ncbi:MAG: carboxypeptidase regulatory-like domain-containing protein, partial [Planctomycetes bacterium]|nr:carboxypeptidase regulatory-like domain-containing protein [Planctomycetota bacterium]
LGEAFFELVLEEAIEGASISGIVVDEAGQPIPGASVGLGAQSERRRETDLDGRWRLEQPRRDSLDPVHLHASAEGFESRLLETQTPWNTDNVRITLTRGIGFEVAAFDAATREPIEEFLLRLFSRDDSLWHVRPWEHRRGAHPGGIARVTGIPRGRYWLVLDPSDARWARSPFLELQVGERMARVEIALQAAAEVTVHVEDREKRPRENSVVTLIESSGATQPLLDAEIESFDAASSLSPPRALRIAEGRTDAQGNVALRAPPRRELSILARGADHRAEIHAGIALQEGHQTLTLTVAGGARLLGRLSPPEVAEQLWRAAGWHREGPAEAGVLEHTPRVQLARWVEGRYETHPEAERTARVERDGRFEISGIPPGNWKLLLLWSRLTTAASPDGSIARRRGGWRSIRLASIENLDEDEERRIELDRPDLVLAELEGTLIVDGAAISSVDVSIIGKQTGASDPSHVTQEQCATDSAGRFSILLEPGVYEVQARVLVPTLATSFDLPTNEQVALAPGQALEREFHVASGEVRLRVLDSAGTPVAGLRLYLCSGTFEQRMAFPLTDAEGRTVGRMPAGTWPLLAEKTGPEKPLLVDVGHLKVAGVKPQPEERELRLPASWSGG